MVRYAFDLYPRTDPRYGAVIRRFEHLQEASYRAEENGTGSGQIKVAGDSPDGEDIDPRGLQYVRVLEIDDSDVETVKGGFWLEQGKFQALTRKETKHLEFGGAGTLAYLQRAVMWSRTYIHDVFTGQDPIGTTWNLANQSTYYANGNHLGAMLWRVIYEAQHFQSGAYTHRHWDFGDTGITHTDTHDDDRTESAIPDLVMTFDQNEDSDGNPWTLTAGTFTAQVGESVLSVTRRLMELGLKVEMDPDTFELNAWEAPHRTDRTSTSWASNKVLFTAPTAQDIDTGNILSDTIRTIRAFIQRSVVLAGSENVYAISEGATDIPWEGGYRFDTEDTGTAEDVASRQRLARADSVDNLKVVMKLGNAPLEGRYRPWVHVNPGDLVTVNTGSDQWEFDNTTFPVAALTVELKQGGDWRAIAELGSSFTSLLEPAFQVGGAPAHTHPPNPQLCLPGTAAVGGVPECYDGDDGDHTETIPAHLLQPEFTSEVWLNETTAGYNHPEQYYWRMRESGDFNLFPQAPTSSGNANDYSLGAASEGDQIQVDVTHRYQGAFPATKKFRFGVQWLSDDYDGNARTVISTSYSPDQVCSASISSHSATFTAPATTVAYRVIGGASASLGYEPWNMHSLCVTVLGADGIPGDGHPQLVGTSTRASRCDHSHTFLSDRAPSTTDDESQGFLHIGMLWINTETGEAWVLTDATEDAAVWLLVWTGQEDAAGSLVIEEEDGAPTDAFDTLKVPNGSLTDNADGSASLAFPLISHVHNPGEEGATIDGVALLLNTEQPIADQTITAIDFETELFDTNDYWDAGSPSRITIPEDGWYEFHAGGRWGGQATFNTSTGQMVSGRFRIDGGPNVNTSYFGDDWKRTMEALSTGSLLAHGFHYFEAGQYVELTVYQNTGETINLPHEDVGFGVGLLRLFVRRVRDGGGGGEVTEEDVRDAGRWEVVVSGTAPPVALTNEAEDDWLYAWVSGA